MIKGSPAYLALQTNSVDLSLQLVLHFEICSHNVRIK